MNPAQPIETKVLALKRAVPAQQITPWTVGIRPTWTVAEVRAALQQHADGNFSQSAQLVDSMGEDDEIPGALEKYVDSILGSDFRLDPVDQPNRQLSKRLAEQLGAAWWDMFPESELDEFLRWHRMLGVAIGVLDWDRGGSKWTARLRVLHPEHLRYDPFRRQWIYSAQEGELVVDPGNGQWILLCDGARGWMRGAVRALTITWIAKQLTIRDWNRYNERHGLPIIKAYAPAIADEGDADRFWEEVKGIQSETVVQLPTHLDDDGAKFELELLEAKDGSWQTFKAQIERADRKFQIHLLGANMAAEVVDGGARATADVHRGVERAKATAGAKKLSTELRRQALFPIAAFNSSGIAIDVIPWPVWDTAPAADDMAEAAAAKTFGEALVQFDLAGYEIENIDDLAERYGVKLKRRELQPPPPPLPVLTLPPADDTAAE
ncbi:MAG: DUF935 family protein [Gemmatimonadaceae bacterium]|nr:DUF935 family protein [Gemmatimonadaceae bacterium]